MICQSEVMIEAITSLSISSKEDRVALGFSQGFVQVVFYFPSDLLSLRSLIVPNNFECKECIEIYFFLKLLWSF